MLWHNKSTKIRNYAGQILLKSFWIHLSRCEYFVLRRTICDLACSRAVRGAVLLLKAKLRGQNTNLKTAVSLRGSKQLLCSILSGQLVLWKSWLALTRGYSGRINSKRSGGRERQSRWHSRPERGWRPNSAGRPSSSPGSGCQSGASIVWWSGSSSCPNPNVAPGSRPCNCPRSEPPMWPGSRTQASTWPVGRERHGQLTSHNSRLQLQQITDQTQTV